MLLALLACLPPNLDTAGPQALPKDQPGAVPTMEYYFHCKQLGPAVPAEAAREDSRRGCSKAALEESVAVPVPRGPMP